MEHGIPGTLSDLCEDENIKNLIMDDMAAWAKEAGLKPFEQVITNLELDQKLKLNFCHALLLCVSGEGYISTSRTVFRTEWFTDTHIHVQTTATEIVLQTSNRRHV